MTRRRIALVIVVLLLGAITFVALRATVLAPRFDVPSIANAPPYRDPALLGRAWALPVASTFEHRVVSQANGSLCGPTSIANILRSLGQADASRRYLVNFHRGLLFGKGHGHHSPIAAYLEAEDLVLVLDVNEDFGPWLVSTERLFRAMDTVDGSSGKKRGLLVFE